jgi:predicted porin
MYADYQEGHWQWRATYAQMTFKHDLPPPIATLQAGLYATNIPSAAATANSMALTDTTSRFYSLGAVYDKGPLLVQAMLSQVEHESHIYENTQAGYLITGYRVGELTPFAAYSWSKSKSRHLSSGLPDIPPFAPLNTGLQGVQGRVHTDQHTYTLGSRWDFRRNAALKAQVDFIRGKPESVFLYPGASPGQFDGKMNVYSLALDFVF